MQKFEFLRRALQQVGEYKTLKSAILSGRMPTMATALSRVHKVNIIDTLPVDLGRRALVVVSDEGEAARMAEDLAAIGRTSVLFPARDLCLRNVEGLSHEYEQRRIGVLSALLQQRADTVIATVDALMLYTVPQDVLKNRLITLESTSRLDINKLCERLICSGYTRCNMVDGEGQFAVRGGIADIFVPGFSNPVRIEFWDDEIDSMSTFDIVSQRRLEPVQQLLLSPARELVYDNPAALAEKIRARASKISDKNAAARERIMQETEQLQSIGSIANADKYINQIYDAPETLLDYMGDAIIFLCDPSRVYERVRSFSWQTAEDTKACFEDGTLCRGFDRFSLSGAELYATLEQLDTLLLETFTATKGELSPKTLVSFDLGSFAGWGGMVSELADDIKSHTDRGYAVAVLAGSERAANATAASLADYGIAAAYHSVPPEQLKAGSVIITDGGLPAGIEYREQKLAVFTHARAAVKKRRKKYANKGAALGSLEELKSGEAVVHSVYGIGIFEGIQKIETSGVVKDYIRIRYQKDDVLYVPVTQLDLVARYVGAGETGDVRLSKLGADQWIKQKSRVKAAVRDMAEELIKLYAARMQQNGFAFSEDSDLQHDFEYHFPYDETDDQLRCTQEIKSDMQRSVPMERLLCGDVGFGKTEVALRAAFKCVADGKQCAILVPTTILAWQHYKTLLQRMEHFPVNVEMLSRFRTAPEQTKIKKALSRGELDIVVGTHRLISADMKFHDLGLLVIDEEQRFGVAQKEKLKQLYPNVDVLTLSATPIPRTLNMAMSGLRDMSILEEAPQDRHPVQTYVLQHDRGVLLDAIRKELGRGGQVYYIYNRVETIDRIAARLQAELPDANVAVAHGQMDEEQLSEVWRALIDHEIDLLVCTTIIETGVDVPNVNTLIIEDADRFGLSQLHQLRGRVGRSSRRAYAYFTFRRGKLLSDIAQKRLEAIREYTEFGSGFKIAMRDLEIRGAGNILGAKQHGQMESVGYDMYLKLLSDAIAKQKGEKIVEKAECVVDLQVAAHIPESYIESLPARLQIYRRIAEIATDEDAQDVMDELIDRFGEPPVAVLGLIDIAQLRNRAASVGINEINDKHGSMVVFFSDFQLEDISALMKRLSGRVMVSGGEKPYLTIRAKAGQQPIDVLRELIDEYCEVLSSHVE